MNSLFVGSIAKGVSAVGVVMAGGFGTRFWPASRRNRPKQFLPLGDDDRSLIQNTVTRLERLTTPQGVMVVTGQQHVGLVKAQVPGVSILVEPFPRNTAPCIGYAAITVLNTIGDVPMVCVPADHLIAHPEKLISTLAAAVELARVDDVLVTVGIPPTAPETGYGYIHRGVPQAASKNVFKVQRFVEKPVREKALEYLKTGEYFWNSGMFVWRPSVILSAITQHLPALGAKLRQIEELQGRIDGDKQISEIFLTIDPVSIDVGVMEKANNAFMIAGDGFAWSDVGSWSAWAECLEKTERDDKNSNLTKGQVVTVDSNNCVVVGDKRLVAVVGLDDVIVVETDDAVLVCRRDRAQDVKRVTDELEKRKLDRLL